MKEDRDEFEMMDFDEPDLSDLDFVMDDFGDLDEPEEIGDEAPEGETTEQRGKRVLTDVQAAMRNSTDRKRAEYNITRDEKFYLCIYFPTREQMEAYRAAHEWPEEIYLRGLTLAEEEGIVLPETPKPMNPAKAVNKKLAAMALTVKEKDHSEEQSSEGP